MTESHRNRVWLPALLVLLALTSSRAFAAEVAVLTDFVGYATYERDGKTWRAATGQPMYAGDAVITGKTGKVRLLLRDNSVLNIGPRSKVRLTGLDIDSGKRTFSLDVLLGRFKIDVAKWFLGDTDGEIRTPTAVAGVRGTVVWGDTELDAVCALEGTIELRSTTGKQARTLRDGACAHEMKAGKVTPLAPAPEDLKRFLAEVTIP